MILGTNERTNELDSKFKQNIISSPLMYGNSGLFCVQSLIFKRKLVIE